VRGTPFNIGDGFKLANGVDAQETGERGGCHSTCWDAHAPNDAGDREITNQFSKLGYPLGVMVNNEGKRFVDEGEDFRNYTYAKFGRLVNEQPEGIAWQIWDTKTANLLRKEEYADNVAKKIRADTLEELVAHLCKDGVQSGEQLTETLSKYNQGVALYQHKHQSLVFDPSVKDGLSTDGIEPPKSNWAQTIDKPPFIAVKIACGITFTFYGLKIDSDSAAVLDQDGKQIKGLYAAGEMVKNS
jgi:succinate dehydrogenase/fumarate reductase flavoprotein subunit